MNEEKPRIMVVDDDKVLLKNAAILLGMNYSVSLYSSGKEALDALEEGVIPDLILLDVKMPEIDGYTVIQAIKKMESCENVPVVFVTGLSDEEDELKGLQLGAADYIKKPYSQKILLARVSNLIKSKENSAPKKSHFSSDLFNAMECKIADLVVKGYNGREISEELYYSYSYVKRLLSSMREKTGCETLGDLKRMLIDEFTK